MNASPPWRTDAWDLETDLAKIEQQWTTVRRILQDEALSGRSDDEVSEWSCGQHAGHLLLIAGIMADRIEHNLREPELNREREPHELAHQVFTVGGFRRGVVTSPREAVPDGRSRTDFLTVLDEVADTWAQLGGRVDELADCPARSEHFALGYLTSSEWVRMCAIHSAHHLRVVRDIVGSEPLDPDGVWEDA